MPFKITNPRVPVQSNDSAEIVGLGLLVILAYSAAVALQGWLMMIFIGVLHAETGLPPRTTGFWTSVLIALLYGLVTTRFNARSEKS